MSSEEWTVVKSRRELRQERQDRRNKQNKQNKQNYKKKNRNNDLKIIQEKEEKEHISKNKTYVESTLAKHKDIINYTKTDNNVILEGNFLSLLKRFEEEGLELMFGPHGFEIW
jgi:hypothetical protein